MNKITIVTNYVAGIWTAIVFVGNTIHCEACSYDRSEAVQTAVAIFRLA